MFRWTAEMLLAHLFLEGLVDGEDDGDDEVEGNEKILLMESTLVVYESDDDFEYSSCSDIDGCLSDEEFSYSYSEDEEEIDSQEEFSSSATEQVSTVEESTNSTGARVLGGDVTSKPEQVTKNTMQQCPIPFSIPAGV